MTITTKYDIGQKVYYPTQKPNEDKDGRSERVVRELTVSVVQTSTFVEIGGRIETVASYRTLEYATPIEECFLFPTEEAAWEEHVHRELADDRSQDEVAKWGD